MIQIKNEHILLNQSYRDAHEAIVSAGEFLLARGLVEPEYIEAMLTRQERVSVYVGNFVALPHGDEGSRAYIKEESVCLIQVPDGVNFGTHDNPKLVTILFVVALKEAQLEALQELAFFCSEIDNVMALSDARTIEMVQVILQDSL